MTTYYIRTTVPQSLSVSTGDEAHHDHITITTAPQEVGVDLLRTPLVQLLWTAGRLAVSTDDQGLDLITTDDLPGQGGDGDIATKLHDFFFTQYTPDDPSWASNAVAVYGGPEPSEFYPASLLMQFLNTIDAMRNELPALQEDIVSMRGGLYQSVANYADLPTWMGESEAGQGVYVTSEGSVYVWDGTAFPAEGSGVLFSKVDAGATGTEVAYAQISDTITFTTEAADVPGLTVDVPASEQPVMLEANLGVLNDAASGAHYVRITSADNNVWVQQVVYTVSGVLENAAVPLLKVRIPGVLTGDTFKVRVFADNADGTISGPSYLRASF